MRRETASKQQHARLALLLSTHPRCFMHSFKATPRALHRAKTRRRKNNVASQCVDVSPCNRAPLRLCTRIWAGRGSHRVIPRLSRSCQTLRASEAMASCPYTTAPLWHAAMSQQSWRRQHSGEARVRAAPCPWLASCAPSQNALALFQTRFQKRPRAGHDSKHRNSSKQSGAAPRPARVPLHAAERARLCSLQQRHPVGCSRGVAIAKFAL